jgi:SAM-dependent methyltransferase
MSNVAAPIPIFDRRFVTDDNVFRSVFGTLSDKEWFEVLVQSLSDSEIAGVEFPSFPDEQLQTQIHGHSGRHSILEALIFYTFVKERTYPNIEEISTSYFLDFAAGWGRISRLFLRDFNLKRMFAYEPNLAFCSIGRACNPFINYLCGDYLPDGILPAGTFNLAVGWSIFSHLSEFAATAWLEEMGRIMAPGGQCVFTTWGLRFLERLRREAEEAAQGKPINWYSKICIDSAGSLDDQIKRYGSGEFVWFTQSTAKLYGEAFVGPRALSHLIEKNALPFDVVVFDAESLAQDAFVLKRR